MQIIGPLASRWLNCADLQTLHRTLRVETPQQLTQNLKQLGSRNINPTITFKMINKFDVLVVRTWLSSDRCQRPNRTAYSDPTHGMYKVVSRPSA